MTGKLMYVVHSRLDIAHAMGIVARFLANPRDSHMIATKRILRYLKKTKDYGLWYPKDGKFELRVYTDADWAGNVDDRKSTIGGAFFFGERLVTWTSKKQACISQSIAEEEYVATTTNYSNIAYIKQVFEGMNDMIT